MELVANEFYGVDVGFFQLYQDLAEKEEAFKCLEKVLQIDRG